MAEDRFVPVNPKSLENLKRAKGFRPGESGNPGGRPSILTALSANGTDTQKLTAELAAQLIECMRSVDKAEASWRFAVDQLANRLWGKPKESMDLNVAGASPEQQALLEALVMTPHERRLAQASTSTEDDAAMSELENAPVE